LAPEAGVLMTPKQAESTVAEFGGRTLVLAVAPRDITQGKPVGDHLPIPHPLWDRSYVFPRKQWPMNRVRMVWDADRLYYGTL